MEFRRAGGSEFQQPCCCDALSTLLAYRSDANAAAAGLGAAWLSTHLWHHAPVTPAVVGLAAAVFGLLLPLTGSLLTAVALGVVSLAGALPAVVAQVGARWWQRALFAAAGFCVLIGVSRATHHDLYWLPAQIPPQPRHVRWQRSACGPPHAWRFTPLLRLYVASRCWI